MSLDIKKVNELYYIIAKDQYSYSDSEQTYYKLVTALERLTSCVDIINEISLEGQWNRDATSFVVWINYVDLMIAAIEKISTMFDYKIVYQNELYKYHKISNKNDKDFFRFIRAIVLPHALELDYPEQKVFTNGKKAYCPHVVWDTKGCVRIIYYNCNINNYLNIYKISISDIAKFVEYTYNQIDVLCEKVKTKKRHIKNRTKGKLKNEKYNKEDSLLNKCRFLKEITLKYGDLDDKSGKSFEMQMLERCEKICLMKFYGKNKLIYEKYKIALNIALDDYYNYLCQQRNDEKFLDYVLFPLFTHNRIDTSFDSCLGYYINKIVSEMENFDQHFEMYSLTEFYNELKTEMSKKVAFKRNMSMERMCFLVIMVQFFDKLENASKYNQLKREIEIYQLCK